MKKVNPALGEEEEIFTEIHSFLDCLNSEINTNFKIIKKRYFPDLWKLGFAYFNYSDTRLDYTLYPIRETKNDIQIKKVDMNLRDEIMRSGLGFTGYYQRNPLKESPCRYARESIQKYILNLLKNKMLDNNVNMFLAKEFIIAFIDKFHQSLGLEPYADTYKLDNIITAFNIYLPIWIEEALKIPGVLLGRKHYIDPAILLSQIFAEREEQVKALVLQRIKGGKTKTQNISIGNDEFPFALFQEFLFYMKEQNIQEIGRVYLKKDWGRCKKWVFDVYSPEVLAKNLEIFFTNLPNVYEDIISNNFPDIKEKLPLFRNADKIIIIYSCKEQYENGEHPSLTTYFLKSEQPEKEMISLYKEGEITMPTFQQIREMGGQIELGANTYKLISMSNQVLRFIYDDLPMLDYIYNMIEENIKHYFESESI